MTCMTLLHSCQRVGTAGYLQIFNVKSHNRCRCLTVYLTLYLSPENKLTVERTLKIASSETNPNLRIPNFENPAEDADD